MDILSTLKDCYELKTTIKKIDEKIEEINTMLYYPKAQTISDMPKGGGGNAENVTDKLISQKNKLQDIRHKQEIGLIKKWSIAEKAFEKCRLTSAQTHLLTYRFYYALPWKKCGEEMKNLTGQEWNENKVFRTYRSALCKFTKNGY